MALEMEDIFEAASCAQSLSVYLSSMEAEQDLLGLQVQALKDSEFEAGLRALEQASRSETEAVFLVREARGRFNKALSFETGLRLAHTHVALAICHSNLGDGENAGRALQETLNVSIPPLAEEAERLKGIGIGAGMGALLMGPLGWLGTGVAVLGTVAYRAHQSNIREGLHAQQSQELEELKESVRSYLHLPSDKSVEKSTEGIIEARCPDCGLVNQLKVQGVRARVICPHCSRYYGVDV